MRILPLLMALGSLCPAWAQPKLYPAHQIDSVTVYLQGALVHRSFEVSVPAGESNLVFEGLTHTLEGSSVAVGLQETLRPQSVTLEAQPWNAYGEEPYFTQITDSLQGLEWEVELLENQVAALKEEQAMLQENRQVSGGNTGVSMDRLQEIATFMRTRTQAIQRELSELGRQQRQWQKQISRVQAELNRYRRGLPAQRKAVSFVVESPRAQRLRGTLSYYVQQANWNAVYDVQVASLDSDLKIQYKANLYNGTYENWDGVQVRISTASPRLNVTLPTLDTWRLSPNQPQRRAHREFDYQQNLLAPSAAEPSPMADNEGYASPHSMEVVEAGEFAIEFRLQEPVTLAGNYAQRVYPVQELSTPALYQHYAIPKLGKQVYLIARVPQWNRLNLLSGQASIYFNGRYTGQSNINIRNVRDTLEFSLGEDPQVLVSRKLEEDFSERLFIGTKVRERKGYALFVKNSRTTPIQLRLLDQFPLSTNEDIDVSLVIDGGAQVDDDTGTLTWNLSVNPGQVQQLAFTFEVVYPKNSQLKLNQSRPQARTPRFSY